MAVTSLFGAGAEGSALRGTLRQQEGKNPAIETAGRQFVYLEGDKPTLDVLRDERLKDADVEVIGRASLPGRFEVNHIHLPSIFIYRAGKRLQVSYWCDVCYIRTSSPGKCWCCQKQTDLDPVEPEH